MTNKLKIIYIGTNKWAKCLEAIHKVKSVEILHCFIPDGKGRLFETCNNLYISYTITQNINNNVDQIKKYNFDIYLVIGHPFLLRNELLCINDGIGFHPSLLPKRRGRAPINWAIIDGLRKTGVSIFKLGSSADDGGILFQEELVVEDRETALSLKKKIESLLIKSLPFVIQNFDKIIPIKQNELEATYTKRRYPSDSEITLDMSVEDAEKLIRALYGPYPSAHIKFNNGEILYIHQASLIDINQDE